MLSLVRAYVSQRMLALAQAVAFFLVAVFLGPIIRKELRAYVSFLCFPEKRCSLEIVFMLIMN